MHLPDQRRPCGREHAHASTVVTMQLADLRIFTEPQQGAYLRRPAGRRPARRGARLRCLLPQRPLPRHGWRRRPARPDRRLDHARRAGPRHVDHPPRHAGHAGHVPQPGSAGHQRRPGRPDERRPGRARHRRRLVRGRARGLLVRLPVDRRAVRLADRPAGDHRRPVAHPGRRAVQLRGPGPLGRRLARAAQARCSRRCRSSSAAAGARKTPRLAARYATEFNLPFAPRRARSSSSATGSARPATTSAAPTR